MKKILVFALILFGMSLTADYLQADDLHWQYGNTADELRHQQEELERQLKEQQYEINRQREEIRSMQMDQAMRDGRIRAEQQQLELKSIIEGHVKDPYNP